MHSVIVATRGSSQAADITRSDLGRRLLRLACQLADIGDSRADILDAVLDAAVTIGAIGGHIDRGVLLLRCLDLVGPGRHHHGDHRPWIAPTRLARARPPPHR